MKSKAVLACLRISHLTHLDANGRLMWVGFDPKVGGFVYVQLYPTAKSAYAEAKLLADEESGLAHKLVISQHIAPYRGSPVPKIVSCLHGRMISKPPKKPVERFVF